MKKMVVILCIVVLGIAFLAMPAMAAQTCGEDILDEACECNACAANLNFKATPTCGGVQLTWNDIGADGYFLAYYYPPFNWWLPLGPTIHGKSLFLANADWSPGTYSFAVISSKQQENFCYSNIVCDVKLPTTCTDTPEFPSIFLPAAMIIGFLGAVLLIQRTREH